MHKWNELINEYKIKCVQRMKRKKIRKEIKTALKTSR